MSRAAVLIGVNRTGGLPVLNDAASGARSMERWALAQGLAPRRVLVFTDEQQPVEIGAIKRAIRTLVDSGAIEQLIVYFAGHGVNIRYGEYWLLSDAPVDPSAAVNVEGSIVLARRSGIPHVVFISDACRTAAEGIQAQGVTGSEIFPNDPVPGPEQAVDVFFATTLGRPALEVKDPAAASASFHAVYTQALLDAVSGRLPAAVKEAERDGRRLQLVRPRPLKSCLLDELPRRLAALALPLAVDQVPDARITSDDDAWLAQLDSLPAALEAARAAHPGGPGAAPSAEPSAGPSAMVLRPSAQARFDAQLEAFLRRGDGAAVDPEDGRRRRMPGTVPSSVPGGARPEARGAATGAEPVPGWMPGPRCGIVVRGAEVADCLGARPWFERSGDEIRMALELAGTSENLLLIAGNGSGVLVPVVEGFIATLEFDDDELVDVAYEPAFGASRWEEFQRRAAHLRELRRLVASAARSGVFHPQADSMAGLARQMRYGQTGSDDVMIDPTLALHVAYALHDQRRTDAIRDIDRMLSHELSRELSRDLSLSFFDLALLSGDLRGASSNLPLPPPMHQPRHPPFPMLARGWALLPAFGVALPDGLEGIQRELLPSLWTHFNPAGAGRLRELMLARRLR